MVAVLICHSIDKHFRRPAGHPTLDGCARGRELSHLQIAVVTTRQDGWEFPKGFHACRASSDCVFWKHLPLHGLYGGIQRLT